MKRDSEPISKLLQGLLAHTHKQASALFEIQQAWEKIAGKSLAKHAKPVSLRKGKLVVHAERPGENFELNFERERVARQIKALVGDKVEQIIIRAGKI